MRRLSEQSLPAFDFDNKLSLNTKRVSVILCEDVSGSMASKYTLMNEQLKKFFSIKATDAVICGRTDLYVIKFSSTVSEPEKSTLLNYNFNPFTRDDFNGQTHLWSALLKAVELAETIISNNDYTPWILLYTDGFPNNEVDSVKDDAIAKLQSLEKEDKLVLFILGIGYNNDNDKVNKAILESISKRGKKLVFYASDLEIDVCRFFDALVKTLTVTVPRLDTFAIQKGGAVIYNIDDIVDTFFDDLKNQGLS